MYVHYIVHISNFQNESCTLIFVLTGDDVDEWGKVQSVECLPLLSPDFQFQLNTYFNQGGKRFTSAMRCRYRSANII